MYQLYHQKGLARLSFGAKSSAAECKMVRNILCAQLHLHSSDSGEPATVNLQSKRFQGTASIFLMDWESLKANIAFKGMIFFNNIAFW